MANLAAVLGLLGHTRAAADLLWAELDGGRDQDYLAGMLGSMLIDARDGDGVRRLADRLLTTAPSDAHWLRARWAAAEDRWAEVGEHCAGVLAHEPDAINTRRLAATAATRTGDHAAAQRIYQELLEYALTRPRPGPRSSTAPFRSPTSGT